MHNADHPRDQGKHSCPAAKLFFTAFFCPFRASAEDLRNEKSLLGLPQNAYQTPGINELQHIPVGSILSPIVDTVNRRPNLWYDVRQMLKSDQYAVSYRQYPLKQKEWFVNLVLILHPVARWIETDFLLSSFYVPFYAYHFFSIFFVCSILIPQRRPYLARLPKEGN